MTPTIVTEFLTKHGHYRVIAEPLHVADVTFVFDAVLVGPGEQGTLVLVVDVLNASIESVRSRIEAFSLTLNRKGIGRPITIVALNCDAQHMFALDLTDICRVLTVPNETILETSLRPLLPLNLPKSVEARTSSEILLRHELEEFQSSRETTTLLNTARLGAEEVSAFFRKKIAKAASLEQMSDHDRSTE